MHLILSTTHETVLFAGRELESHLRICGLPCSLMPKSCSSVKTPAISLGLAQDIPHTSLFSNPLDDAFEIEIQNGSGFICGSNPRSVLYGVYYLLRQFGFDWPNPQTEVYLPKAEYQTDSFSLRAKQSASVRHRGIVLEGANHLDNIKDILNWMPKLYYNSYFIQFQLPCYFFANWYHHVGNPYLSAEDFTENDALRIKKSIESEIRKRGLLYHAVGHAWTSESIGITGLGWDPKAVPLTEWQTDKLAMVRGKRQLFDDIALNTNLCYSNPEALELFAAEVVRYMKENPQTDFLHIWLADGYNNFCECPLCHDKLPSEQYIEVLNYLDAVLCEEQIDVKLVFLTYYDLLWAPIKNRLVNPERFVLMFAPISRTFESSYADVKEIPPTNAYQKNKIDIPHSVEQNLSYLRDWRQSFSGDGFVFDYPLGRAHYGDPGYIKIARTIYHDIRSLKKLSLNGYLSCQEQRCFFPHALPNYLMGLTLWDNELSFDRIVRDFFIHSYGEAGEEVFPLLEKISYLFNTDYWNHVIPHHQPWYSKQLADVAQYADALEKLVKDNITALSGASEYSALHSYKPNWNTLSYLPEYIRLLSQSLIAKASGDGEKAKLLYQDFAHYVRKNEYNLQPSLDVFRILNLAHYYVDLDRPEYEK